jgi:hypothetical protein
MREETIEIEVRHNVGSTAQLDVAERTLDRWTAASE